MSGAPRWQCTGGLITPPLLIGSLAPASDMADIQTHLVASALIVSGICTIVHVRPPGFISSSACRVWSPAVHHATSSGCELELLAVHVV